MVDSSGIPSRSGEKDLHKLFDPQSIAVVGASEAPSSRGAQLIEFLRTGGYRGRIYPVNPKYDSVSGMKCYPSVAEVVAEAGAPDSVALCLRAEMVADAVEDCARLGLTSVAVVASGFSERGDEIGRSREAHLAEVCASLGVTLVGPNCMGISNRVDSVNYWMPSIFRQGRPQSGASIIMQSGALVHTAVHLAQTHGLDFDFAVSSGNEVVLRAEDYMEYILSRGGARVIGLMREGIKEPRRFAELCLRARKQGVAVVVLPVGRSEESRRISSSHTGSLIGSGDVLNAFCDAFGVVRASTMDEWISLLLLLSQPFRPTGNRLAVYSLSGGGSALAADIAADVGLELAPIPQRSVRALKALADDRPVNNPVDAGGYYGNPAAVPTVAQTLLSDPDIDAVAVCANSYREDKHAWKIVEAALAAEGVAGKPFAVFSFGSDRPTEEQQDRCRTLGAYPLMGAGSALRAMKEWLAWSSWQPGAGAERFFRTADEKPGQPACDASSIMAALGAAGVRLPERTVVGGDHSATALAYPVVAKFESDSVAHKTDLGLVELDIENADGLRAARQRLLGTATELGIADQGEVVAYTQVPDGVDLILGMVRDPVFGPAITVGLGGIFVEVFQDAVTAIPPVDLDGALVMIDRLKGKQLLAGVRGGEAADVDALARAIVAFSEIAVDVPENVRSFEINPIRVLPGTGGAWALDVLVDDAAAIQTQKES